MIDWRGRHGVYLIAEIGGNHEGHFERAVELTRLALDTGVDAVKYQVYTGDSIVSGVESPDRNAHFKRFELTREQYVHLAEMCRAAGTTFAASVWNADAFGWMDPYLEFYKIGSGDLTAVPLLRAAAAHRKPIILSTGLSTMAEVAEAVDCIRQTDPIYAAPGMLALLQCTSMYPIPLEEANLRVMDALRGFGSAVGYSDHTTGTLALETAVAREAQILEFHFTDRREGREFRDHKVSLTPSEVRVLIARIRATAAVLGTAEKRPTQSEIETGHVQSFRRAVFPRRDLPVGTVIAAEDLIVLRPAVGIDAREFDRVVGAEVLRPLRALSRIEWSDLSEQGERGQG